VFYDRASVRCDALVTPQFSAAIVLPLFARRGLSSHDQTAPGRIIVARGCVGSIGCNR